MKLMYHADYLSIKKFNEINLPDFTILTGLNGAGKSHLLNAIIFGHVVVIGISRDKIIQFDNGSFMLDNEPEMTFTKLNAERMNILSAVDQLKLNSKNQKTPFSEHLHSLIEISRKKGIPFYFLKESDFFEEGLGDFFSRYQAYATAIRGRINQLGSANNSDPSRLALQRLFNSIKRPIEDLTEEEFFDEYIPYSYKNNFLITHLGKIFSAYWEKWERNVYLTFRNSNYNESHKVLSEEEFVRQHGEKPWNMVNRILDQFGSLEYKVDSPEGLERGKSYMLKLISTKDPNIQINFDALSSGEKTMLALVSSLFKAKMDSIFPHLLLLDEIDATLHPSMTQNMLNVIATELVKEKQIKVILVTHSPSTVALAPEGSIFVMNKQGIDRIESSTNEKALQILTEGFASLTVAESNLKVSYNISKSSKNVLLTEGITDRIILEAAWKKIEKAEMNFDTQDCFDAGFLRTLFARGEIFTNYPDKTFVALFDFDAEGYNAWNNLKAFEIIEHDPKKGLIKKHPSFDAYALLLPVPDGEIERQVIGPDKNTFRNKAHLTIELMFYNIPAIKDYFTNEAQPGGGSLIKFTGNKSAFANNVVSHLSRSDFRNLIPLFNKLKTLFSKGDK